MYIDQNLLFADTLTTTTSGAATDHIDNKAISIKLGDAYKQMWWVVKTEAAFAGGAACTALFQLQTSNDATFADSTTTTLAATAAFLTAELAANKIMSRIKVPLGMKRYTRVYMVVGGTGVFTTASYSSFLTTDVDNNLP